MASGKYYSEIGINNRYRTFETVVGLNVIPLVILSNTISIEVRNFIIETK
jgi:hypothetical protein